MKCRFCGGPVEWVGWSPFHMNYQGTRCLQCGGKNCHVVVAEVEVDEEEDEG